MARLYPGGHGSVPLINYGRSYPDGLPKRLCRCHFSQNTSCRRIQYRIRNPTTLETAMLERLCVGIHVDNPAELPAHSQPQLPAMCMCHLGHPAQVDLQMIEASADIILQPHEKSHRWRVQLSLFRIPNPKKSWAKSNGYCPTPLCFGAIYYAAAVTRISLWRSGHQWTMKDLGSTLRSCFRSLQNIEGI